MTSDTVGTGWSGGDLETDRRWTGALTAEQRRRLGRDPAAGAPPLRDQVLRSCRALGFAHVRDVADTAAPESAIAAMLAAALPALGQIVPQNGQGDLLQVLRDENGDGRTALGYHCDTSDLLVLLCLHPAADGGGLTRLVDARHVATTIGRERPDALATLQQDFAFDRRGRAGQQIIVRPIFRMLPDGAVDCYYQSRTVRDTPRTYGPPHTAAQLDALAVLDDVLQRPGTGFGLAMAAGDLLVIRNNRLLHGRSPFVDEPGPRARRMIRIWMNTDQL